MSFVNPEHPRTRLALQAAASLADDFFPATEAEMKAQTSIYAAVAGGDLYDAIEALNKARRYATRTWRDWQTRFVHKAQREIFDDLRELHRREAA